MRIASLGILLALLGGTATAADEQARPNDFPTVERVLWVEACIRDHPDRQRQELIYKCSCALDALAGVLTYTEYVDSSTAFFAGQAAGERGTGVRETSEGRTLADRYRRAHAQALEQCMIVQ